ncbi:MAG: 2,3-bisphosphoglycerate-independent phosphoglycerate mutase [Chloroflexi bacterium]|nr:2,3-bisphosphoglycerate-independent phosphoglycerate mutase [Chloroflexota bacterium]
MLFSWEQLKSIAKPSPTKIVLLVLDGLGGLPRAEGVGTELETAQTPHLDELARKAICGLMEPIAPGVTPGSGSSHLALFGYDPVTYMVGRGAIEALGIGAELREGDVAARGNFCTVDGQGVVTDRRAGRISSEKSALLCQKLNQLSAGDGQILVTPVKEHRFVAIFRGVGLSDQIRDSDPQQIGLPPLPIRSLSPQGEKAARLANEFIARAKTILADSHPANMILLRGFSQCPNLPRFEEIYPLKSAAIAPYTMYQGLARLLGMEVLVTGTTLGMELDTLEKHYSDYDFFYIHFKDTDVAGEDGRFDDKVQAIEQVDAMIPRLLALQPDVVIVTGDHSTPAVLKGHSWHPVPFLLFSPWCRPDTVTEFSERACNRGGLGRFPATQVMTLALAHAKKLSKFGA